MTLITITYFVFFLWKKTNDRLKTNKKRTIKKRSNILEKTIAFLLNKPIFLNIKKIYIFFLRNEQYFATNFKKQLYFIGERTITSNILKKHCSFLLNEWFYWTNDRNRWKMSNHFEYKRNSLFFKQFKIKKPKEMGCSQTGIGLNTVNFRVFCICLLIMYMSTVKGINEVRGEGIVYFK